MRTPVIVKPEVIFQSLVSLIQRRIGFGIDLFIFDRPPEPFHKDVVMRPSSTIHPDLDPGFRQTLSEREPGKLCALIGVEDGGLALRQRFIEAIQAKAGLQGVRQSPR